MSLVQLSHSMRIQNMSSFKSDVCKCIASTSLKQFLYHGWSVLASIALSINLSVVIFLQAHPSVFFNQNTGGVSVMLFFHLWICPLNSCILSSYQCHQQKGTQQAYSKWHSFFTCKQHFSVELKACHSISAAFIFSPQFWGYAQVKIFG